MLLQLYALLKDQHDFGSRFKKVVTTKAGLDNYAGMSAISAEGTTHTVKKEEQVAFSNWINRLTDADEFSFNVPSVLREERYNYI